ncbi:MAG TPA: winged helix-turn-helix domain-containing tetratricopeptide repeat protein [Stellaceae bacterium]|nr:winged helix-turn-helix domain-containing tetratricopeptide repeat protein [Stellaceae bacterium]
MPLSDDPEEIRFGRFRFDLRRRCLLHDGEPVELGGRALDVLHLLASAEGAIVSKDELMAQLWPGRAVAENNLHVHISALRKALDEHSEGETYIITVPGRGYRLTHPSGSQRAASSAPPPARPLPLPDKPSIAVLPFANLSADPEQEYFSDGVADDIITALSRYPSLLVIARNSSFSYKTVAVDVKRVGGELGVRYVLEGSVRTAGRRIRVTAQLIETEAGAHIWADRYDGNITDVFTVQDEIARAVTTAIAPAIADAERQRALRRPPGVHDAWNAYQRGLWHLSKATRENNRLAQQCFAEAIALDANFSGGYHALALAQMQESGLFATLGVAEARVSITDLARRAVAIDEGDAEAHACLSWALNFNGDYQGALSEAQRALLISPNLASAHRAMGTTLIFSGQPRRGRAALEVSIRLDPRDPLLAWHLNRIAIAHYFAGEYDAAIDAAQRVIRSYPEFPLIYRWLAAALGQASRTEEARQVLEKAIAIGAGTFDMYVRRRVPWHRPEDYEHMLEGLRKAGWQG